MKPELSLIVLRSLDQNKLTQFYESTLGFKFHSMKNQGEDKNLHGDFHNVAQIGGFRLEIYQNRGGMIPMDDIGFRVDSIDRIITEKLQGKHVKTFPENTEYGRHAVIWDTDNRKVHLYEDR